MCRFRCVLRALTLAIIGAANIQSQNTVTGEATDQPVASVQTVAYCDFLEQLLNPFRRQPIIKLALDRSAINRTCKKNGAAPIPS
jgi:hypothetical protein